MKGRTRDAHLPTALEGCKEKAAPLRFSSSVFFDGRRIGCVSRSFSLTPRKGREGCSPLTFHAPRPQRPAVNDNSQGKGRVSRSFSHLCPAGKEKAPHLSCYSRSALHRERQLFVFSVLQRKSRQERRRCVSRSFSSMPAGQGTLAFSPVPHSD